jgi:glycosyltransferase involved in cell wall biosynthesis
MNGISILIFTKNEQQDLPGALDSVRWSDDIHVFDSMSDDATVKIAETAGATVTSRLFDDESTHKNWGLSNIAFKHEWIYLLDADERIPGALKDAMFAFVAAPGPHVALRVRRRDYLWGTWLRRVTPSPFNIRLIRRGRVHFERLINPVTLPDGPVADTQHHFDHYPFSKGMRHWFEKHNRYSTMEAEQILSNRRRGAPFDVSKAFFGGDSNERRFHQKELFYRLPMRPLVMFVLLYVARGGFLDGSAGLTFAVLRAIYEYMIVLKVHELERAP